VRPAILFLLIRLFAINAYQDFILIQISHYVLHVIMKVVKYVINLILTFVLFVIYYIIKIQQTALNVLMQFKDVLNV
jgi:hypothetical protein